MTTPTEESATVSPLAFLGQYQRITAELASAYRERGDVLALQISTQAESWANSLHLGVTERRENSREATSGYAQIIAKLDGEIAAYEAELRGLAMFLQFHPGLGQVAHLSSLDRTHPGYSSTSMKGTN